MLARRLGWARGRASAMLPDRASVIRITQGDDGAGGRPRTETVVGTYDFRLQTTQAFTGSSHGREDISAERLRAISDWVGFFPYTTIIQQTDIVLHNGLRYEITGTTAARTEKAVLALYLRRLE